MYKKQNRSKLLFRSVICILAIIFLFNGCGMIEANRRKKEQMQQDLDKQRENYFALLKDLQTNKIKIGTSQQEIEAGYGAPEDTFDSSSEASSFSMWSYECPQLPDEEFRNLLRLYFNDGKLTSWTN